MMLHRHDIAMAHLNFKINFCVVESDLLVFGDRTGLIYRNRYCSLCHGEGNSHNVPAQISCDDKPADSYAVVLWQLLNIGVYNR